MRNIFVLPGKSPNTETLSGRGQKAPLWSLFVFLAVVWAVPVVVAGAQRPPAAAIASAHPLATEAGMEILAAGGNAFDAAVTVSAVLAVVEPYSSGIGGGGFWLLHRAADAKQVMIDGRERAPLAATRDMYLDAKGEVVPKLSIDGALAAGIPGEPAALVHIAEHYGRLPLSKTLAPAIELAERGFAVDAYYQRMAKMRLDALNSNRAASSQFLANGEVPPEGYVLLQRDLAETLRAMAAKGRDGFYTGEVARKLVTAVREAGGIWDLRDLAQYQVIERPPVRGRYRDMQIVSAAPPSSGGVVLMEMLNILSQFDLSQYDRADRVHLLTEAMRRAYRDRSRYLGDPDHVSIPIGRLISPGYGVSLARDIQMDRATLSNPPVVAPRAEGMDTTHFSIIDREGNRVAATLSINYPFGAAFVAEGTGVLLNDEMDDFSARPGVPNVYGLTGGEANAIAPGKRMLSSMTPTFVESRDGVAILGSPGGSRIITMVLQGILALSEGQGPETWVSNPRIHHQYLPDRLQYEPNALSEDERLDLTERGHTLEAVERPWGNMQAVYWDRRKGVVSAASDPRGIGEPEVR